MIIKSNISSLLVKCLLVFLSLQLFSPSNISADTRNRGTIPVLSLLLANKELVQTVINDDVIVLDDEGTQKILTVTQDGSDATLLQLEGGLAESYQPGKILLVLPGTDDRYPFGISGRVGALTDNAEGTTSVSLEKVTYADLVTESYDDLDDITLDSSNFVGLIAPASVEPTSMAKQKASSSLDPDTYSFRNGAIIVRSPREILSLRNAKESISPEGAVSLNIKVELAKMGDGVKASTMNPVETGASVGFEITGELDNIKITQKLDFSLKKGLNALDLRLDGDFNFDVKFNGKGFVKFGYFSQAWKEVADESFKILGVEGKYYGLSTDDKIGKYPIAGLVWSVPCPNTCPVVTGNTQTPLRQAKELGVIVWIYLTLDGEFSLDGELSLARLNNAELSLGIEKSLGGEMQMIKSLKQKPGTQRLLEAPNLDGTFGLNIFGGMTMDVDFFTGGIYIANAGMDVGIRGATELQGKLSFGTASLSSPWSWEGSACFSANYGAGAVFKAGARFGNEIKTAWKKVSGDFEYEWQLPTDEEMNTPGWHGGWYTAGGGYECWGDVGTVTSAGQVWMDRNLGAFRVATSITDMEAYGDLYQWGRDSDGHEKRNSPTTSTLSSSDNPGHGNFITTLYFPYDWRTPQNDNLWQGVSGVNNPCPAGFRLPTETEWKTEEFSWGAQGTVGAYNSPLKLVPAGTRSYEDGSISYISTQGVYWSSTIYGGEEHGNEASYLGFNDNITVTYEDPRALGFSVRCIKDTEEPLACDSSHLDLCYTEGPCVGVGGYWYDSTCNSIPQPTCDSYHLNLCSVEGSCLTAGGYWYNNTCISNQLEEFGTVVSAGQVWMDRNLGALRVATSSNDVEAYGDLYQWGRLADGHEKRTSSTTTTLSSTDDPGHDDFITTSSSPYDWRTPQNNSLWQGVSGKNNPCPSGFRLPTDTELATEQFSWDPNNSDSAFASPLKLVVAGYRDRSYGTLYNEGSYGYYWSSTVGGASSRFLFFNVGNANVYNYIYRAFGYSVRCIKD